MKKEFYDQFYHLLRVHSNEMARSEDPEETQAMRGITNHLLSSKGEYVGLLQFLSYYGKKYIAPQVTAILDDSVRIGHLESPKRIVDFGAGLGWLSDHLSYHLSRLENPVPNIKIDKRQWFGIDIVADVESSNGLLRILDALKEGDLIVMCEFLHCITNGNYLMDKLGKYPVVIIEYFSGRADYQDSYKTQIVRFGAESIPKYDFTSNRKLIYERDAEPYYIWLYSPIKNEGDEK